MISLMANCFSWIKRRREPWKKITILMIGLDNAGKTSTVADLTGESTDGITPTVGFLTSSFSLYRYNVTLFDLGGGARIRAIWKNYYAESFGIVFVVDASDLDRLEECRKVLHETEMQPQVSGKPLLILGNKQDCPGALNEDQIYKQLELDELTEKHRCPCQVFCCTAVLGKGNKVDRQIKKGFRWLLSEVSSNFTGISRKVEKEMAEQKREQDEEKERRRERVRLAREAREKAEREAAEKENQEDEESDDGVVVSKDKKKKKERPSPEAQGSKKKKKERETPEPDSPEKKKKKKKKKKKQKTKENENDDAQQRIKNEQEPISNGLLERIKAIWGDVDVIHRCLSPDETLESRTDGLKQLSPRSENRAVSDDTEVKKKKKKKKRKVNKTAPAEGEVGEDAYELPPPAWGTPPGTMHGFSGSGSGTPRRLEPLGPTRRAGSSPFGSPSIPEGDEPEMSLPPLRVTSWPNTRPNSEDCDLVT